MSGIEGDLSSSLSPPLNARVFHEIRVKINGRASQREIPFFSLQNASSFVPKRNVAAADQIKCVSKGEGSDLFCVSLLLYQVGEEEESR